MTNDQCPRTKECSNESIEPINLYTVEMGIWTLLGHCVIGHFHNRHFKKNPRCLSLIAMPRRSMTASMSSQTSRLMGRDWLRSRYEG